KDLCEYNTAQKPSHSNKDQVYSQVYDSNNSHLNQILFLKNHDNHLDYNCDFNKNFKLSFCNNCHSRYTCFKKSLKNTNIFSTSADTNLSLTGADTNPSLTDADTNPSPTMLIQIYFLTGANTNFSSTSTNTKPSPIDSDSLTNSSLSNSDLDFVNNVNFLTNYILSGNSSDLHLDNSSDLYLELQAKVIINVKNFMLTPAKWFKFYLNGFDMFYNDLIKHIRKYHNNKIDKNNIEISYKVNGRDHAIALDEEYDYDVFITECKNLSSKKFMELLEEDSDSNKETSKKKSKKLKTKYTLKESVLASNEIKLANIILQIRTKYQYHIHPIPCYIEDNKHLQLTPSRLHL
ncbi:19274_t:CDS:2, partial [Racocetra persica]